LIISSFILHRPVFFITQQCSKLFNFQFVISITTFQ